MASVSWIGRSADTERDIARYAHPVIEAKIFYTPIANLPGTPAWAPGGNPYVAPLQKLPALVERATELLTVLEAPPPTSPLYLSAPGVLFTGTEPLRAVIGYACAWTSGKVRSQSAGNDGAVLNAEQQLVSTLTNAEGVPRWCDGRDDFTRLDDAVQWLADLPRRKALPPLRDWRPIDFLRPHHLRRRPLP
jgi:hypothetical protein